jgi:hypothetical protein
LRAKGAQKTSLPHCLIVNFFVYAPLRAFLSGRVGEGCGLRLTARLQHAAGNDADGYDDRDQSDRFGIEEESANTEIGYRDQENLQIVERLLTIENANDTPSAKLPTRTYSNPSG